MLFGFLRFCFALCIDRVESIGFTDKTVDANIVGYICSVYVFAKAAYSCLLC